MSLLDYTKVLDALNADIKAKSLKEQQQILQNLLIKGLAIKNIPVSFARGRFVKSIDQIEQVIAEVEKEYFKGA